MKTFLHILALSATTCFGATFFPKAAAFNSPAARVALSPLSLSVVTNSSGYVTNSDFYFSEVVAGSGTFGEVWTATNTFGISRSTADGIASDESHGVISYVSPGYSASTFVSVDLDSGVECGTTFVRSSTYTTAQTTNNYFSGYVVESLAHHIYTNLVARTNGRSIALWSVFPYSIATKNTFARNSNCLLVGISNLTAISQCNQFQGSRGQMPITALTRRHGYYRGHGAGVEYGATSVTNWVGIGGSEVVFVGHDNTIVTMLVSNRITVYSGGYDYSILIFTADLPASITPLKVATNVGIASPSKYPLYTTNALLVLDPPRPILHTEQNGNVDTSSTAFLSSGGIPGFKYNSWKGGDSGSPDMILVDGDLVFIGGRSTSPPSDHMQGAMDALSTLSGLSPASYQMEWKDLSAYPEY